MASSGGGGKGLLLLLVLVIAGGAGAYNYHRNMEAEVAEQGPRPFDGYSDADLETLADAYRSEISQYQRAVEAAFGKKTAPPGGGLLSERVQQFERVQATSGRQRALQGELIDRQGKLAAIEKELALRAPEADKLAIHMKRLLTI